MPSGHIHSTFHAFVSWPKISLECLFPDKAGLEDGSPKLVPRMPASRFSCPWTEPNDLLLMQRIWQWWWATTCKVGFCDFHLAHMGTLSSVFVRGGGCKLLCCEGPSREAVVAWNLGPGQQWVSLERDTSQLSLHISAAQAATLWGTLRQALS